MRKDHDRGACREALNVLLKPVELLAAKIAQASGFQVEHVDEADIMNAMMIEALPPGALGVLAIAFEIGLAPAFIDDVVLARRIEDRDPRLFDDLICIVEFLIL